MFPWSLFIVPSHSSFCSRALDMLGWVHWHSIRHHVTSQQVWTGSWLWCRRHCVLVSTGQGTAQGSVRSVQKAHTVPSRVLAEIRAAHFLLANICFTNTCCTVKKISNEWGLTSVKTVESFLVLCEPEFEASWHFEKDETVVVTSCPPGHVKAGVALMQPCRCSTRAFLYGSNLVSFLLLLNHSNLNKISNFGWCRSRNGN